MIAPPRRPLTPEEKDRIRSLGLRHFIFFKEHFSDRAFWENFKKELQALSPPGLWAVDQEGGPVTRITPPLFPAIKAPLSLAREEEPEQAVREAALLCARNLKKLGLNFNLAPVLDLAGEGAPPFLRGRTFGEDPSLTARLGVTYLKAFKQVGLYCCGKHFPGLGGVEVDPHLRLPVKERLDERDLIPFKAAVMAGLPAMMTTHLLVPSFSADPVTYSPKFLRFLREELGFRGVVLTDDLFMGGALAGIDLEEAVLKAFLAGHDLMLLCGDFTKSLAALAAFCEEVQQSPALREEMLARLSSRLLPL